MQTDEEAIRTLVDTWLAASQAGDLATVLSLMADDVIFMVPGKEPFGKREFVAFNQEMKDVKMETSSDIKEIKILGDWAWMRNFLKVTFTPPGGSATVHSGYVLTILQKNPNGSWVIARDANLLTPEKAMYTSGS
jgi:uncharacterized protein (TIGR02246 family)